MHGLQRTLIAALCAIAAGQGATQTLGDPLSPAPPVQMCGREEARLSAVVLTAETSYDELAVVWGQPRATGPGDESFEFDLGCYVVIWASFTPTEPRRLIRAIRPGGTANIVRTVLFDPLDMTGRRRCDQLAEARRYSASEIYAAWGSPDTSYGSGIERWAYVMADGGLANVYPEWFGRGEPGDGHIVMCRPGQPAD